VIRCGQAGGRGRSKHRVPADGRKRAWLALLPMVVGGVSAFVSPALLLSRQATASDQPTSGLEEVASAALPVLLAIGTILCGFRAARLVEGRGITSRRFVRLLATID
jgi:hypothetical protein